MKDVKTLEQRIMKLKGELEERIIENKKTLKNTTKLCEYIISRVIYPEQFKEKIKEYPKIKAAVECVTFIVQLIQKWEKEIQLLWKESEDQKILLMSSKRENKYLKWNIEVTSFSSRLDEKVLSSLENSQRF